MTDYHVNLRKFPSMWHRIVRSWYSWQEVYLHKTGSYPGQYQHEVGMRKTAEQLSWGRQPPAMTRERELSLVDDTDVSYYLICESDGYYIDSKERGSRGRFWMFRQFEDAEKYLLFLISQVARPGEYTDSPSFGWYQEGLDPRITLTKPDPINYPGRVSLTVDQEATDRGWMSETDAIAASHIIVLSFEELDIALRKGIPNDWFSINIIGH